MKSNLRNEIKSYIVRQGMTMQQIDHLLHGHALTDDVRLDFISQIGFQLVLPP